MNKNTELTKQEMVELLLNQMVTHDKNGLQILVKEWIEKNVIKLVTRAEKRVMSLQKQVNGLEGFSVGIEHNVTFDFELVKNLKPLAVEVVRKSFEDWVEKEKPAGLAAFVKTVSVTAFGLALRKAGCESQRFNDGIRYLIKIPGLVVVRKKRKS